MKVKINVTVTEEEINVLDTCANIIYKIAEDIDTEDINTFAGLGYYELKNLATRIEDITGTLKNYR